MWIFSGVFTLLVSPVWCYSCTYFIYSITLPGSHLHKSVILDQDGKLAPPICVWSERIIIALL